MRKRSIIGMITGLVLTSILSQVILAYSADEPSLQITGSLSSKSISFGSTVTLFASVKDGNGVAVEDAEVTAVVEPLSFRLANDLKGVYHTEIDTDDLGGPDETYTITLTADKRGYTSAEVSVDLSVGKKSGDGFGYLGVVALVLVVIVLMIRNVTRT